ncbi:MAG: glycosyltransferase, partial [Gemmatimonadota bacterium]
AYYATTFGLPRAHIVRSFVGEDYDEFGPRTVRPGGAELQVLFFGTYVPLHGVEVIVDAATALREDSGLRFTLVGAGQLYPELRRRADERGLAQVSFIDHWVSTAELVERIAAADVCLGIFGRTAKAERVIPYKVYDALAVGRPLITRDSPAIRELLTDGESALLCAPGSAPALVTALRRLADDPDLRRRLGEAGHAVYRQRGCPAAIGRQLLAALAESRP